MAGGGRSLGRLFRRNNIHGIRFRLGLAMAAALLPILVLSAVQTQAGFRQQAEDERKDLQLAAQRSATEAHSRINSTLVLLETVAPETDGFYCEARLTALVAKIHGVESLQRYDSKGQLTCASANNPAPDTPLPNGTQVTHRAWFQRLKQGEDVVIGRLAEEPGVLLVSVRNQRPLGGFEGAVVAKIPVAALQPSIDDPSLPPNAQSALMNARGQIIISTDNDTFHFSKPGMPAAWSAPQANRVNIFTATTAKGKSFTYAVSPLVTRDLFVVLAAPAQGLVPWSRLDPMMSLLLPLITWLVAFGAVMLLSERIVIRWLNYLERIASIYTKGRFSVRPLQAEMAPAEIRVLARTLGTLGETISNRDRALLDSLDEKDALMREIHHRVKNNLQIISSLLSMQQRAVVDPAARAALGDTRQRITALALIYRTLYQGDDIRDADSRTFLNDLVRQMVASESFRGPLVTSEIDADQIPIHPDRLAPMALWLVEAVSNAQKHAFAGRGGHLAVRFRVNGETSVIEVQDDGPGLQGVDFSGVGRTLMDAFARQLRGTAEMIEVPEGGSIARLTFVTPTPSSPD
jgi:two-component sensor histidine kinase